MPDEVELQALLDALGTAAMRWRGAQRGDEAAEAAAALRQYNAAATALIGRGITRYDLDPMDRLPETFLPLVWQEAYADLFADAVAHHAAVAVR